MVCHKLSSGGAVRAALGVPGAGRALKWEFKVSLKQNLGFSRAGGVAGDPRREGWAPSGALPGALGRPEGARRSVRGARRGFRAPPGELLGAHFEALGLILGILRADFLSSWTKFATVLTQKENLKA